MKGSDNEDQDMARLAGANEVSLNGFEVLTVVALVRPDNVVLSVLWDSLGKDVQGILNDLFVLGLSAV